MPKRWMGSFGMFGPMVLVKAGSALAVMAWFASQDQFRELGSVMIAATWGIGMISTLGNLAPFVVWIVTVNSYVIKRYDEYVFRRYKGWLIASNIYGWFLFGLNIAWYLMLFLFTSPWTQGYFHTWAGDAPPWEYPLYGMAVEGGLMGLYQIVFHFSKKLMQCWGYDYPEYGYCAW